MRSKSKKGGGFSIFLIIICGFFTYWAYFQIISGLGYMLSLFLFIAGAAIYSFTCYNIFVFNRKRIKYWLFVIWYVSVILGFVVAVLSIKNENKESDGSNRRYIMPE